MTEAPSLPLQTPETSRGLFKHQIAGPWLQDFLSQSLCDGASNLHFLKKFQYAAAATG